MRRLSLVIPVIALILIAGATQTPAGKKSFNFFLGQKWISDLSDEESDSILDLEKQPDIGVEMSFGGNDWPVMVAVDILASAADDSASYNYYGYGIDADIESRNVEVDVGVRKTWEFAHSNIRPYIGGGLATAHGELELDVDSSLGSFSQDDAALGVGLWVGGGVYWRLGERFNLGFNLRHSTAEVDFDDLGVENVDLGGTHLGLVLGWGY
jgi:hypothetical protein